MLLQPWCLMAMCFLYMFLHPCLFEPRQSESVHGWRNTQDHWANMQHLSSALLPHMHDLCRGCHSDKSDTRKPCEVSNLLIQGSSVQRQTSVRGHQGNNGGPLERATPTEASKKASITMVFALLCHVTRCLGPVLALRYVLFKESLVCSRLL